MLPLYQVGTPQGLPISPLFFVIYISSLHIDLPNGITFSYVDDFSLMAASLSYRTNVRMLQRAFGVIRTKARAREIDFGVPKTELIHWRTPKQKDPQNAASPSPDLPGQASLPSSPVCQMAQLLTGF